MRDEISAGIASHVDIESKTNLDCHNVHDFKVCFCARDEKGKRKKTAANDKRSAFYKTDAGIAIKKHYKEKAGIKKMILNQLSELNVNKKAELSLERITNLIKQLQ